MKRIGLRLVGAGLSIVLLMDPMMVNASSMMSVRNVLGQAGVATLMEEELTNEEYMEVAEAAQGASWGYTNLGIANVSSGNLNIRTDSSKNAKLVGKLPKNAACEVIEITEDGWAHITSGNVEGYVSAEYLLIGPEAKLRANELVKTVVRSETDGLRVRERASVDSPVVMQIAKGEELEYLETLEGWYKVSVDGQDGYVSSEYATAETKLDTAISMTELLYGEGVSDVRVELCEYAKQFVGNPYVWGGTSLTKGADCSGFVLSVFKKFGVKLSHHSGSQANEGTKISASELQAGDLVFYANSKGTINHVAIYIGGGQVIHASSPKTGIKISQYKYRTPVKYVRVLQD